MSVASHIEQIPNRDSGSWPAILYWQGELLAEKCAEVRELRQQLAERDRWIEGRRTLARGQGGVPA